MVIFRSSGYYHFYYYKYLKLCCLAGFGLSNEEL